MAHSLKNQIQGGLVPVGGPDGVVQWQAWEYGELLQHLNNDLTPDSNNLDASVISSRLRALIVPHGLPYNATNWTDFGANYQPGQYACDPLGYVHVSGVIKSVAPYGFANIGQCTIATLPPGFRPATAQMFTVFQLDSVGNHQEIRLDILTDGRIILNNDTVVAHQIFAGGGSNGVAIWLTLRNIEFVQAT